VGGIDDALQTALAYRMNGDLVGAMEHTHAFGRDCDAHALADQPPGHGVSVGIDLDRAVALNDSAQLTCSPERRDAVRFR